MMSIVGDKEVHKIIDKKQMKWVRKLRISKFVDVICDSTFFF